MNAPAERLLSLRGGQKEGTDHTYLHIPDTVGQHCVRMLTGWEFGWLKVDRGEDCSHQHLSSEWPLMLWGVSVGPDDGGMLPIRPPSLPALKSPGLWNAGQAAVAWPAGKGLEHSPLLLFLPSLISLTHLLSGLDNITTASFKPEDSSGELTTTTPMYSVSYHDYNVVSILMLCFMGHFIIFTAVT